METKRITLDNLNEKSFTNLEVFKILDELAMNVCQCKGATTIVLDVIEKLTGNRNFSHNFSQKELKKYKCVYNYPIRDKVRTGNTMFKKRFVYAFDETEVKKIIEKAHEPKLFLYFNLIKEIKK